MKKERSKYIVTTEQKVILRGRVKAETLERHFTVMAYSRLEAANSVKRAGYSKITKVEKT